MINPEITLFAADGSIQTNPNWDTRIIEPLQTVYAEIKKSPLFPSGECISASVDLFFKHGFNIEGGWFLVDRPSEADLITGRFQTHFWSYHRESTGSTIYDLTLAQFNLHLTNPVPQGIIIVEMGTRLWQRYIDANNPIIDHFGLERSL